MLKGFKKGFTLIELLIVIVIIGILAGIVVGIVGTNARKRANDTRKKADFHELQNALELYFQDNDVYPANLGLLVPNYEKTAIATLETNSGTAANGYVYTPAPDGGPYTSYTLRVLLANQNDSGANVITDGGSKYYQVESKQ